jgi:5-carboxymethyl-2-hydroxymuconate isomerase
MAMTVVRMIGSGEMNKQVPDRRIFCIGRNYADHAKELANEVPVRPVIFMKPATSLVWPGIDVHFPAHGHDLQHEVELVVEIGRDGRLEVSGDASSFIRSYSVGIDLTLRDVQKEMKSGCLPWEIAKAFDQSALIGDLVPCQSLDTLSALSFSCSVNGELRQSGHSGAMIFPVDQLLVAISKVWMLRQGDLVYTGTPSGVGPLRIGDVVSVSCASVGVFEWKIVAA